MSRRVQPIIQVRIVGLSPDLRAIPASCAIAKAVTGSSASSWTKPSAVALCAHPTELPITQALFVCEITKEPYLAIEPTVLWMDPSLWVDNAVFSNTDWFVD